MRHLATGFMGSLLLLLGACGGKVVVESSGATGAGTGGAGGISTSDTGNGGFFASTGDVNPVGVVSSSTGSASTCDQLCAKETADNCGPGASCVMECEQEYATAGMCLGPLDALVQCWLTSPGSICKNGGCDAQLQAYQSCTTPTTCGPTACAGGPNGNCDCSTDCNGSKLEVQCQPGNAMDFCVCIKDGNPLDKCAQPQGTGLSCDIVKGCCAKVFFP